MKVDLKGVQSLSKSTFEFPDKGVSLIYGDNSVGKSSIIRAITAAISYDSNSKDPRIAEEQRLLGILQDKSSSSLGLIQVGQEEAKINIEGHYLKESVTISRNGKFKGINPSFVITNILSDVSWIMRVLTHTSSDKVSDYLKGFHEMILRYDDVIDKVSDMKLRLLDRIKELGMMLKESEAAQKSKKVKRKELEEISSKIKAIQEKIKQEAKKDPNKEKRIKELSTQITAKEREIQDCAKTIQGFNKQLREVDNRISVLDSQINEQEGLLEDLNSKLNEYEEVEVGTLGEIEEKLNDLKGKRSKEQILYEILKRTQAMLESETVSSVKCPLCGSSEINKSDVEKIAMERDEAIRAFDNQISRLAREAGNMREIAKRMSDISLQIPGMNDSLERLKDDQSKHIQDRAELQSLIEKEETKKSELERQKNDLVLSTSDENPEREKSLKRLQEEEKVLQESIREVELTNKYSHVNFFGVNYPVETRTLDIFDKAVSKALSDVEGHFSEMRENEKTKLRDDFNRAIKEILHEMSFDLDIFIDNNFDIMARKKTENGYRILETQNLSRSEQATIALTLQLALAKGYSPDVNVILCDGIYEYFDEERRKKIITFVDDFGKKHDKLIIMTVVKEGLKTPTVVGA